MRSQKRIRLFISSFLTSLLVCMGFFKCWAEPRLLQKPLSMTHLKPKIQKIVQAANSQVGKTIVYDSSYASLQYPNGDVPIYKGVCTDVVIRALRAVKFDLQKKVHESMKKDFSSYPNKWGLKKPDPNIDHRRVPNLNTFFKKINWHKPITKKPENYQPGDIVSWKLGSGRDHIGIVTNRKTLWGRPLVVHNIGLGAQIEDVLFDWKITGHFRPFRNINIK